ncbi:MAG: hypothetical protein HFF09_02985 [Oscillospiraceae bacterium]|nr:hypothetical protein [Oscillospiraceae bacterium]
MNALKKRPVAIFITAVVIVAAILGGSHRSLAALRNDALKLFEQGAEGDGVGVKSDLERRVDICANVYAVAVRYLPEDNGGMADLKANLNEPDPLDVFIHSDMVASAQSVLGQLEQLELSEQDADYVSSFKSQLESIGYTIGRDPYTAAAGNFNDNVLGRFPASVLGPLTGVRPLEVFE